VIFKKAGGHDRHLSGLLLLSVALAGCNGGHSSPVEPDVSTLTLQSISPPEGTSIAAGTGFQVAAVVRYHLAGATAGSGRPPAFGGIQSDVLRADGSPLNQPNIEFQLPLFQVDGTVSLGQGGRALAGDGPEVLFRITLFANGSPHAVTLTVHYPIAQ
jgi:hypothetical protein